MIFTYSFSFFRKANFWIKTARDGTHYRLQYDLPGTWSQKYNLVFQNILSLKLFPDEVAQLESDYYQAIMLDFGVALDSRSNLTKSDWTSWIAALSPNQSQGNVIFAKLYKFANESPNRVPLSDCYDVATGHALHFRARSVMGALFARALLHNPTAADAYMKSKNLSRRRRRANKCNPQ